MSERIIKNEWTKHIEPAYNPWVGTSMENLATHNSKKSGTYYETSIAKPILEEMGYKVSANPNSTGPWDLKIEWVNENGEKKIKKVEVKVGRSNTNHKKKCADNFKSVLNHIAIGKDFDILFIVIIYLENGIAKYEERWCTKSELISNIESPNSVFSKQQGGKKANNDDWICSGKPKIKKLLKDPLFKNIDTLKSVL
tara:strand:- start:1259 stop:1849 length:591 start_codon:yes stop_codon:yes gene_type:complete